MLMVVNTSINEPCCSLQVATTLNQCYEKQTILITKSEKGMSNPGGAALVVVLYPGCGNLNGVVIWCNFISSVSAGDSQSGGKKKKSSPS